MLEQTALTTTISKTRNEGVLLPELLTESVFLFLGMFIAGLFDLGFMTSAI